MGCCYISQFLIFFELNQYIKKTPNASMGFFNFEKVKLGALQTPDLYHYKKVDCKSAF